MQNAIAKVVKNESGVTFNFANGETKTFDISELPQDMIDKLTINGLSDKLRDGYSGAKGDVLLAITQVSGIWSALKDGNFNRGREQGGILAQAVMVVTGATLDEVLAKFEAEPDWKKKVAKHSKVVAEINRIKLERLNPEDDCDLEI